MLKIQGEREKRGSHKLHFSKHFEHFYIADKIILCISTYELWRQNGRAVKRNKSYKTWSRMQIIYF